MDNERKAMLTPYYQDDYATIYHGDCREILPQLPNFDLVLTDPPYGIGADKAASKNKGKWRWKYYGESDWDSTRPPRWVIDLMREKSKEQIIWGGNYFADILPPTMGWLVWDKGQRDFSLADAELAWSSFDKALRVFDVTRTAALLDGKQHPTQKSVEVIARCIQWAGDKYQTILDPFLGAGTTLLAAKTLSRKGVGIEINEAYCEIAATRLRNEPNPLFVEPTPQLKEQALNL